MAATGVSELTATAAASVPIVPSRCSTFAASTVPAGMSSGVRSSQVVLPTMIERLPLAWSRASLSLSADIHLNVLNHIYDRIYL